MTLWKRPSLAHDHKMKRITVWHHPLILGFYMRLVCDPSIINVSLALYWQFNLKTSKPTINNTNVIWSSIKFSWNYTFNWIIELFDFILICTVNMLCTLHYLHSAVVVVCVFSCITLRTNPFVPLFVWLRSAGSVARCNYCACPRGATNCNCVAFVCETTRARTCTRH